jgi:hypothetical protein
VYLFGNSHPINFEGGKESFHSFFRHPFTGTMEDHDTVVHTTGSPLSRRTGRNGTIAAVVVLTITIAVMGSLRWQNPDLSDADANGGGGGGGNNALLAHDTTNISDSTTTQREVVADDDNSDNAENDTTAFQITILTYYYPWYVGGDWSRHGYAGTPLLGTYDTSDPTVAEQHIDWAATAIDVLVISWWGEESISSDHFRKGFLQARNLPKTKFCLLYESIGRLRNPGDSVIYFDNDSILDLLIADFQFLKGEYFGHEQYYKLDDGRPVIVMYVTRIFRNFNKQFLNMLQEAIGMDVFIIGDEPFFWENDDPYTAYNGINRDDGQPVFEAYTAYNMFVNELVVQGESATGYMMREALPVYKRWAAVTMFYPHILTSYHDFRGHEPLSGGKEGFLRQLETFACLPKTNKRNNHALPNMLFVTSFNEWWEGTTIEPAKEYGYLYLDALAEFRKNYIGCNKTM